MQTKQESFSFLLLVLRGEPGTVVNMYQGGPWLFSIETPLTTKPSVPDLPPPAPRRASSHFCLVSPPCFHLPTLVAVTLKLVKSFPR